MLVGVESSRISLEDKFTSNFSFNNNCNLIADSELPPNATKSSLAEMKSIFKTFLNALAISLTVLSFISVLLFFREMFFNLNLSILPLTFKGILSTSINSDGIIYVGNSFSRAFFTLSISKLPLVV